MLNTSIKWRLNLRTNLLLWPTVSDHIRNLSLQDGARYEEDTLLEALKRRVGGRDVTDPRAVRNTFEILALSGLAYRTRGTDSKFLLTSLGRSALRFLGLGYRRTLATSANIHLLGRQFIRAFASVTETRAIWMLMRTAQNSLTNEELNRSIARMATIADADAAGEAVLRSREAQDPTLIGPRAYEAEKYGTDQATDQRKAMNPQFLLAGAGGILISVSDGGERHLAGWAVPLIDEVLSTSQPLIHASTDAESALHISQRSGAQDPDPLR